MKKQSWFAPEEIPNNHHFMMGFAGRAFTRLYPVFGAGNYIKEYATLLQDGMSWLLFHRDEFQKSSAFIAEKMLKNTVWALAVGKEVVRQSALFYTASERLRKIHPATCTNEKLMRLVEACFPAHERSHGIGHSISWIVDAYDERFSGGVRSRLATRIHEQRLSLEVGVVFSTLSSPTQSSHAEKEEKSFLMILEEIQKSVAMRSLFTSSTVDELQKKLSSRFIPLWKRIEVHHRAFTWAEFMYTGPERSLTDFLATWQSAVRGHVDAAVRLAIINARIPKLVQEKKALLKNLRPDTSLRRLIELTELVAWVKACRKDALYHGQYCYTLVFREFARRLGLTMQQFLQLVPWEIRDAVIHGRYDADELNARRKESVAVSTTRSFRILTGSDYRQWVKENPREKFVVTSVDEMSGSCAYPGHVRGVVRVVNLPVDMRKMRRGDILVSHTTNPNLLPAMKMARAIVTDAGGLTSHAAIVSRELSVPCVVGTKYASFILKDGDRVEVDATKGIVRRLDK